MKRSYYERALEELRNLSPAERGTYYPLFPDPWSFTGWRVYEIKNGTLLAKGVYEGFAGRILVWKRGKWRELNIDVPGHLLSECKATIPYKKYKKRD